MNEATQWYLGMREKVALSPLSITKVPGGTALTGYGVRKGQEFFEPEKATPDPRFGAARGGAAALENILAQSKTAFRQEKKWYQSPYATIGGGAALGAGGLAARGVGKGFGLAARAAEDVGKFKSTGQMPSTFFGKKTTPEGATKIQGMAQKYSPEALQKTTSFYRKGGKALRRGGLAGLAAGAGLAGYGAYKALTGD